MSTLQTSHNFGRWVQEIIIRLTLPVVHYGQGWVLHRLFIILEGEYTKLEKKTYSMNCQLLTWVNTLQTSQNLSRWGHNIDIRLTPTVLQYGQSWALYRLFIIFEGEYTTFILDLLYQLPIIDKGEYSTDYSKSWKVSTQH